MDYFVRIPELTDKWLAVEAGKLIEENSYGSTENEVIEAYKKAAQDPRSVISPEEIEELANRYIKVWNESVDDVKLEKKRLHGEDKGRVVVAFLENYFARYVEFDFTADLEEKLDLISNNEISWKQVLTDF